MGAGGVKIGRYSNSRCGTGKTPSQPRAPAASKGSRGSEEEMVIIRAVTRASARSARVIGGVYTCPSADSSFSCISSWISTMRHQFTVQPPASSHEMNSWMRASSESTANVAIGLPVRLSASLRSRSASVLLSSVSRRVD